MAPNAKLTNAFKAMKTLGYSDKIVRPVLKELLKLYDKNWVLIEENNYQVLIDAILDSEEEKSNKFQRSSMLPEDEADENEPPLKKSKRNTQGNQSSHTLQASSPNCSNEMKDVKGQDDGTELKAASLSKHCHGKGKNSSSLLSPILVEQTKGSDGESDESNQPVRLAQLENSGYESDSSHAFSEKKMMVTYRGGNHRTRFFRESHNVHDDVLSTEENVFDKHQCEATHKNELLSDDLSGFAVPLAVVPPDAPMLLLQGSSRENCSAAQGNYQKFPEVINLDEDDTSPFPLPKPANSKGNSSNFEGNHPESMSYQQLEEGKKENSAKESLKLDIVSSCRDEVKISLMIESSRGSNFQVPTLEAVLKQVEDQCLKSYGIPQAGFSMLTLMKDVCECFLAAGTTTTHTEVVGPSNVDSSRAISKDHNPQTVPPELIDHQLSLCSKSTISDGSIRFENLFEFSPQIPRFSGSIHLDLSRGPIYLNMNVNSTTEMWRNTKELTSHVPSSSKMIVVQKQNCYHKIKDISNGQEDYEISLINETNNDTVPKFKYIPRNVTYQNARVRSVLAHILKENCCPNCFGDCLSREIPCACAGKTAGEFAYTQGGSVKEDFLENCISMKYSRQQQHNLFYCKDCPLKRSYDKSLSSTCEGHIPRKFIKECWYKCGCNMSCGNRVVQQGITSKLQVFMTPEGKGWGLRTLEDIPKGVFVCEYVGEVVTIKELSERNLQNTGDKHTFPVLLDANWGSEHVLKDEEALCLDATVFGNVARFINHRCFDANLVEIPVEVESPDHHYYHFAFFTTRKVNALEELTWDYGINFTDHQKAFDCRCDSKSCRDRIFHREKPI